MMHIRGQKSFALDVTLNKKYRLRMKIDIRTAVKEEILLIYLLEKVWAADLPN